MLYRLAKFQSVMNDVDIGCHQVFVFELFEINFYFLTESNSSVSITTE